MNHYDRDLNDQMEHHFFGDEDRQADEAYATAMEALLEGPCRCCKRAERMPDGPYCEVCDVAIYETGHVPQP